MMFRFVIEAIYPVFEALYPATLFSVNSYKDRGLLQNQEEITGQEDLVQQEVYPALAEEDIGKFQLGFFSGF